MSKPIISDNELHQVERIKQAKDQLDANFKRKGIITAVSSGMFYGTYTAFMTLAMSVGVWSYWYSDQSGLSSFAIFFLLSALGAAITDSFSAMWAISLAVIKGKFGDFLRCLKTRPGAIMIGGALIGGPLASTFYVIGLQTAGSIVVPISALCPAIGAIIGHFVFKQGLNKRMIIGILICLVASFMIGSVGLTEAAPQNLFLGLFFGFLAALGWGIEGSVCGYSSSMIDPEIGITIRQVTSGLANLFILVPIFAWMAGISLFSLEAISSDEQILTLWMLISSLFSDGESMKWFVVAGLGAYFGFMLWYKGNSMCGAALGMSCNGAFSFWGPFFCWIILGLIFKQQGWALPLIAWIAALTMIVGIFTIATNPLNLFKSKA